MQSWKSWRQKFAIWLAIVPSIVSYQSALAQIAPDGTLPNRSEVQTQGNTRTITGGTQAGRNLFHSFEQFSVPAGSEAFFNNASNIQNIINRVTGKSISEINGLIRANGTANLFLINPNGIIFGKDAALNIGGSFIASTANSFKFPDGQEFSATSPQTTPLLTMSAPIGLQMGSNPGTITNRSQANDRGLAVKPGRTIALVGGDINFEGGRLTAKEGQIELGGVSGGLVGLDENLNLRYGGLQSFRDINLSKQAVVDASGEGGGKIQAQGRFIRVTDGSQIHADTLGNRPGRGISINATEALEVNGRTSTKQQSSVTSETRGSGAAGAIAIDTKRLRILDGAAVSTGSSLLNSSTMEGKVPRTSGSAGAMSVRASDEIEVSGEKTNIDVASRLTTQTRGTEASKAGDLTITTGKIFVRGGGQIAAGTFPQTDGAGGTLTINAADFIEVTGSNQNGNESSRITNRTAGDGDAKPLTITTRRLLVQAGGFIHSGAISRDGSKDLTLGSGGALNITASDSIELVGVLKKIETERLQDDRSLLTSRTEGRGNAGNLTINTSKLVIQDGAQVSAGVLPLSTGEGGKLTVNATDFVKVFGESEIPGDFAYSRLTTRTSSSGKAGGLTINTGKLIIQDGGEVSADTLTRSNGKVGKVEINASESVDISGKSPKSSYSSQLSSRTENATSAGDITINTPALSIRKGAQLTVSSTASGDAGNIIVDSRNVRLDEDGFINSETVGGGGGNILLRSQDLLLIRRGSRISTTASGGIGNGGNINIDANFIVGLPRENSDITADAIRGRGGNIKINTQGIFGIEARDRTTSFSDITASSELGINGNITLNTPDTRLDRGLVNLPSVPLKTEVVQTCKPTGTEDRSEFIITGRGGLPKNPEESLSPDALQVGLATLEPGKQNRSPRSVSHHTQISSTPERIVEAQGWVVDRAGRVTLVAQVPSTTPKHPSLSPTQCLQSKAKGR